MAALLRGNRTYIYVCEPFERIVSSSILYGGDVSKSSFSLLLLQISLTNIIASILKVALEPFIILSFVPEMLSGIVMGPSALSQIGRFRDKVMLPVRGTLILNIINCIALVFLFFLMTLQVDFLNLIRKTSRLTFAVGITSFVLPIVVTIPVALYLKDHMSSPELQESLPLIAILQTIATFRTVLLMLVDLKLLNSELGSTALNASVISVLCTIISGLIIAGTQTRAKQNLLYHTCRIFLIIVIFFVLRPIMLWMMRQTPEKKSLKEKYMCGILLMILGTTLFGEITGLRFYLGPVILGMATPSSAPMGCSLMNRLESVVYALLLPCLTISIGKHVDIFNIGWENFLAVNLLAVVATFARFIGAFFPPLHYRMPVKDAFPLALILSSRGIFDVIFYYGARCGGAIGDETFTTMTLTTIIHSTIVAPMITFFYDMSRKYMVYDRRTLQHARRHCVLQVLACIHEPENLSSMINILELSYSNRARPLTIFVINLEELGGSLVPLFISHKYEHAPGKPTRATNVVKSFRKYEEMKNGAVSVECFSSASPYNIMHDYVCKLANDKCTALIIIPFQKSDMPDVRAVNKRILAHSPCSVAIFVARGLLTETRYSLLSCTVNVCIVFLGGCDYREALAYATRISENANTSVTVLHFVDISKSVDKEVAGTVHDISIQDIDAIRNFKTKICNSENVVYKEKQLAEASETVKVLQTLEDEFDVLVVGRRHDESCKLLEGLSSWIEIEELGVIGDIFVASDASKASVLVIQQQPLEQMIMDNKV